jgi:Probable zinc-ribbon domain
MALVSSRFEPYGQPMQFATAIPFVSCVKCGERLFLPETSEYADAHSVRHRRKCGRCDHERATPTLLGIASARSRHAPPKNEMKSRRRIIWGETHL